MACIQSHTVFSNIQQAGAVDVNAKNKFSGHHAAFNADSCTMALTSQGKYKCGANLVWVNQLWSVAPGIPMNPSAISRLSSFYLEAPGTTPWT